MPSYLVETYLARGQVGERTARERRARAAAEELTRERTRVRFDHSIHVPDDEICFFVFEAPSSRDAATRRGARRPRSASASSRRSRSERSSNEVEMGLGSRARRRARGHLLRRHRPGDARLRGSRARRWRRRRTETSHCHVHTVPASWDEPIKTKATRTSTSSRTRGPARAAGHPDHRLAHASGPELRDRHAGHHHRLRRRRPELHAARLHGEARRTTRSSIQATATSMSSATNRVRLRGPSRCS